MNIGIDLDDVLISNCIGSEFPKWKLKRGARKYLSKIAALGFKLHLITARDSSQNAIVHRIASYIERRSYVKFDSVTLTSHRIKGSFAKNKNCIYMVDDYWPYLSDCEENGVIPIQLCLNSKPKVKRTHTLYSWLQLYEFLSQY